MELPHPIRQANGSSPEREHAIRRADTARLPQNIKARLPELEILLRKQNFPRWQDLFYRNARWLQETRPILEALFHVRTMLDFAIRCGKELQEAPESLSSAWAAVLYLFNLR